MKLVKENQQLWVAEQRGVAVFERSGKAGGPGRIGTRELDSPEAASAYLQAKREALIADGFVCVDETTGISDPFTVDGKRPVPKTTLPKRYSFLGDVIRLKVRCGYTPYKEVVETIRDLLALEKAPRNLEDILRRIWSSELASLRARTPPMPCVNDQIDAAFNELLSRDVIALQNAGFTKTDGWEDAEDAAQARGNRAMWRGACFFSSQDVEGAVKGQGLSLSFGAFAWRPDQNAESDAVGHLVVDVLGRHSVNVEWSGQITERIRILPFEWYRIEA